MGNKFDVGKWRVGKITSGRTRQRYLQCSTLKLSAKSISREYPSGCFLTLLECVYPHYHGVTALMSATTVTASKEISHATIQL